MTLEVSFEELSGFLEARLGRDVSFERLTEREVRVVYRQHMLLRTVKFTTKLKVAAVMEDAVIIGYSKAVGMGMLVDGALSFLKSRYPELEEVLTPEYYHNVRVDLTRLPQAQAVLDTLALRDIRVLPDGLQLIASLR